SLSAKDTRIAKAHRDQRVPTLEQIRRVIQTMPASTEIERRDRALIAPHDLDRRPRRGDRIAQAQAHRYRSGAGRPGRARGEDEVLEVVRALVLSGRRGYPPDRGRLGHLPAAGEALGARRSAIPRNEDRGWGQSAFRGIGPRPQALEQRRPYP